MGFFGLFSVEPLIGRDAYWIEWSMKETDKYLAANNVLTVWKIVNNFSNRKIVWDKNYYNIDWIRTINCQHADS